MEEGLITQDINLHKLSFTDYFQLCRHRGFGCALYRLPQSETKHLIIDFSGGQNIDKVQIETLGKGFIFHPFSSKEHKIKFLNEDIHLVQNGNDNKVDILNSILTDEELENKFEYDNKDRNNHNQRTASTTRQNEGNVADKETYINLIQDSLEQIREDKFQKVVISRNRNIQLKDDFDAVEFFNTLCGRYKNAFVHLTYIPKIGTWTGATPETLISIDKNDQFQTVALAATQAFNKDIAIEETTWSQKDIEEQAMVSRYIINCFKKIRLREFDEIGPRTYLSGNLVHLKTSYQVNMKQVAFPDLGSVMLELLHPTSAVCGMPQQITRDFIETNEGFDREYFSGYLGPVNIQDETNIFVNLRCMKIESQRARLFAGAGIITNSNPEKEWLETEIKMDTLLSVLNEG